MTEFHACSTPPLIGEAIKITGSSLTLIGEVIKITGSSLTRIDFGCFIRFMVLTGTKFGSLEKEKNREKNQGLGRQEP
jgi:hypothetical protein